MLETFNQMHSEIQETIYKQDEAMLNFLMKANFLDPFSSVLRTKAEQMVQHSKGLTKGILPSTNKAFPTNRFIHLGVEKMPKRIIKRKTEKVVMQ